jgi:hypothetical protein
MLTAQEADLTAAGAVETVRKAPRAGRGIQRVTRSCKKPNVGPATAGAKKVRRRPLLRTNSAAAGNWSLPVRESSRCNPAGEQNTYVETNICIVEFSQLAHTRIPQPCFGSVFSARQRTAMVRHVAHLSGAIVSVEARGHLTNVSITFMEVC